MCGVARNTLCEVGLTNRKQCVEINCVMAPQGSILGPLLFLIYVNDMHESSAILKFVMFADDTCLFFSHKDKKVIENVLAEEDRKILYQLYIKIQNEFKKVSD